MQAGLCLLAALTTVYFLSSSVGAYHVPRCLQRKEVGPCRANIPRYFYNRVSKMCELFYYGGCHGNSNNFATLDKCERSCVPRCFQTKYFGQYNKESIAQQRFYYNRFSKQCEPFHYGGRRGNDNNFRTSSECQRRCDICSLKRDPGYCKGHFPRYYYDSVSKSCKMFIYGGCGGNMNNFKIRQTCEARCQPKTETKHKSCAIRCPRKRLPPVCGSDGKTYPNYCILKETACRLGQNITFVHTGPCRTEPKTCAFPCPRKRLPPVCGSDGKTYPNYCILREKACKLGQDITFIHKGPCKPKCQTACTLEYNPQCGTDGKTYGNPCQLKLALCESDGKVRLDHHGECKTKKKTCAVVSPNILLPPVCGSDGNTYPNYCIMEETACYFKQNITAVGNRPCKPKCRLACTLEYNPQCGTDSRTYGNPCQLKFALCESDGGVKLAHHGKCEIKPKKCLVGCPRIILPPVCGSDGNTYPNYCILEETACQFKQNITVVGKEPCEPKCQTKCTLEYNPQCGTDGKTYGNPCLLKVALCESDGEVRLDHHGECKTKPKKCLVACPKIMLPSVCGSDGNTYPNYCILEETACQFKQNITVVGKEPCEPRCQIACTKEYNPQCGTDGKTYGNPCQLKATLCESDGKVRLDHHGECKTKPKKCLVACPKIMLPSVCGSDGNTYPNYCILEETACQFKQNITVVGKEPCEPRCQIACTKEYNPQCGTDGKTYGNPCQLKATLCESDGKVRLDHHGECKTKPKKCLVACPRIMLPPVCGSDGNTYPNYCILEETACQFKQNITVVGKEPCEPKCRNYCTLEYNPQCGTDGKTYGNPCQLKVAWCESDGEVRLDHHGECKTKPKKCLVACPRIILPPVCGSDGNTYPNYCILEETACQFKQNITVVGKEPCKPKCSAICTEEYNPQCGTDGRTYSNPCTFKQAQCESDGKIRLAHHGECKVPVEV
ncbi:agrin-like isoform X6 [Dendronephthya gigantea]|uniref:agrin-like isoform X6 n=1 Tax=Dendronephthya gigantea TaxID=151771 RepID=UPI00106C0FD4|nr:agrin-like isoform X6 [Dendronephthya gigantea]